MKSRGGGVALVVGGDLKVTQIVDLEGRALVGKIYGRSMFVVSFNSWMGLLWESVLDYTPIFPLLS